MFKTKKSKIKAYLAEKKKSSFSAFDVILHDYIDGSLAEKVKKERVSGVEIHIDWLDNYKCIDVQGKLTAGFIGIQVEPDKYIIGIAPDEVEDYEEFPLLSADEFYDRLHKCIGESL